MDKKEFYKQLIHRYVTNQATEDELEAFFSLLQSTDMDEELKACLTEEASKENLEIPVFYKRRKWPWIAAAASVILALGIGSLFLFHSKPARQYSAQQILPGSNKAILTLANGQKINLNDAKSGQLAKSAGIRIIKDKKGQITYVVESKDQPVQYNSTVTPKGGQWHLILSDGTNVWLNAASSLRYPAAFNGSERRVELTGEGYFEVAKDKKHPFIVETAKENVRVLGTHFNINCYTDEPIVKTTLLEGSVNVFHLMHSVQIKPGEQALLTNNTLTVQEADIEEAVAWKDGRFIFNDEPLASIMRKVSRWYDVDVEYRGVNPQVMFGGTLSRYGELSKLLHKIELTQKVHFKIEGRKIIATP